MMDRKWDRRFMEMAALVATWSKDKHVGGVGAVITDRLRRVVSLGYAGFPRGVRDTDERYDDVMLKLKLIVHAEANAVLNAMRSVRDCTLYCTRYPCSECAKLIVQSGVVQVISPPPKTTGKWAEDAEFSKLILNEGGTFWSVAP